MSTRPFAFFALPCLLFAACHVVNGLDDYTFDAGQGGIAQGGAGQGGGANGGAGGGGVTLSVRVEGLSTALSVQLNGGESLEVMADGVHSFGGSLSTGASYDVTFASPDGELCSATDATGVVDQMPVEVLISCAPTVRPLYPQAANWLDYLNANASAVCNPTTAKNYVDCIHAGERRAVYVPGASDCQGVSGSDTLGAFSWVCDDSGPYVQLVSERLRVRKGLIDLIDFSAQTFKDNAVEIQSPNGMVMSVADAWWNNPFAVANANTTHDVMSTIYLVVADAQQTLSIDGHRVAMVVDPTVTLSSPAASSITVNNANFVWFEGAIDKGITVSGSRMSVLRNVQLSGSAVLQSNTATLAHGLDVSGGATCVAANGNTGLAFEYSSLAACGRPALFENGTGGYASNVIAADFDFAFRVDNANGFAIESLVASNAGNRALNVVASSGVHLSRVLTASSNADGVRFDCTDCSMRFATSVLSTARGFHLSGSGNYVSNLLAANNALGIHAENLTMQGRNWIAVGQRASGVAINLQVDDSSVTLGGVLKLGDADANCMLNNVTGIGAMCMPTGASNFSLSVASLNNMFGEKVTQDDAQNDSDTAGTASFSGALDWVNFERPTRCWGYDGTGFPNQNNQGRCDGANPSCRIWDWVLRNNNNNAKDQNGVPNGNDTGSVGGETFLQSTIEVLGDGIGNDDTLCETNERCLFAPNAGSYQGHGGISSVAFDDGTISGVTLFRFVQNGG